MLSTPPPTHNHTHTFTTECKYSHTCRQAGRPLRSSRLPPPFTPAKPTARSHLNYPARARAQTKSVSVLGRADKKGRGEQISRYPEHWLGGTNVSDIIYDVKCSVSALPPLLSPPPPFFFFLISGSDKPNRHMFLNVTMIPLVKHQTICKYSRFGFLWVKSATNNFNSIVE